MEKIDKASSSTTLTLTANINASYRRLIRAPFSTMRLKIHLPFDPKNSTKIFQHTPFFPIHGEKMKPSSPTSNMAQRAPRQDIGRFNTPALKLLRMALSISGWILAVYTRRAVPNSQRLSIPCSRGTRKRQCATPTYRTSTRP